VKPLTDTGPSTTARLGRVKVFSTCAQSRDVDRASYAGRVADVARWSEAAGCEGILVYTDNGIVDPWLVSQLIIQATERLCPLVAVQSVYMHPYSVAKMVSSLAHLHGRRLYLNFVAGGFRNDLSSLGDDKPHDARYERTLEYGTIVKRLVTGPAPVTFAGRYYSVENLRLTPPVPEECVPGITISGSSPAGLATARALGAIAVKYPLPVAAEEQQTEDGIELGIRVGIIAREDCQEAWRIGYERFPLDRKGQIAHRYAMRVSDSQWHHQLAALADAAAANDEPYWLGPFENYKTFCPYLVGDYRQVAAELAQYMRLGFRTFILDIPACEEDLHYVGVAFAEAVATVTGNADVARVRPRTG
jgi:alkanesulfonate monooxygenase